MRSVTKRYMNKILLVYRIFSDNETTKGIYRKMLEQARCLERMGATVDMIGLHTKGVQLDGKLIIVKNLEPGFGRQKFLFNGFYSSLKSIPNLESYNSVYIRFSPLSFGLVGFMKHLKKIRPSVKIYLELATYPFIKEYSGFKKLFVNIAGLNYSKYKKYVTNIVAVSNDRIIWDIPVINIKNGIDTKSYKLRSSVSVPDVIRLVMVSTFWNWHGIDRLVNGMIEYQSKQNKKYTIYLTLVGEGPELGNIIKLAEHPAVKDNIFFFPPTYGGELNQYFDQADIAIGTLAVDRLNFTECSALKHREYGARGIPFIYAGKDVTFDDDDFTLSLPLKEGPIDFNDIELFFEKIKSNPSKFTPDVISEKVRNEIGWESQLQFLIK